MAKFSKILKMKVLFKVLEFAVKRILPKLLKKFKKKKYY